ncbi:DUF421 domain-containing protein [Bacillus lacus]|uniref:DUF421 domain-containing protein n=1 Tax=Metabacillus lacus TaxID=1983721 RepID=A0A7X2LYR0_9BACI|nr:YetF domain-containing protein [Metabacillus lacus]MRX73835.1 DUF421 domain-containing protein [Metabacillus lacus]
MFFNSWEIIGRTTIVGILGYAGLLMILRLSGKRTLTKMNAFDLVITVALGSTLATILLNKDVALMEGLTAFFVLIGMQYLITTFSRKSSVLSSLIKSKPELLYFQGTYNEDTMKKNRMIKVEVLQAVRSSGIPSMEEAEAVILETYGSISVLQKVEPRKQSSLQNVKGSESFKQDSL